MTASPTALMRTGDSDAMDLRLPTPVNKTALANYLTQLEDPEALELQNRLAKAYDAGCRALIGENDIQKEGAREFKKKSAWRKLSRYFGVSTTVLSQEEKFLLDPNTGASIFLATCTVRGTAPWGQTSDATAACATDEETGRRKISIADAIATAETRATNRVVSNLIAMGEVSAEEVTREERERVVQKAAEEMTVEEAAAVKFPWRQPEKYRDKPLGELSTRMLKGVLDSVKAEIEKVGATPRRTELAFAAELLIATRQMADEQRQIQNDAQGRDEGAGSYQGEGGDAAPEPEPAPAGVATAGDEQQTEMAAIVTPPVAAAPVAAAPAAPAPAAEPSSLKTMTALTAEARRLLQDPVIQPDQREIFKQAFKRATTLEAMQEFVTNLSTFLKQPF